MLNWPKELDSRVEVCFGTVHTSSVGVSTNKNFCRFICEISATDREESEVWALLRVIENYMKKKKVFKWKIFNKLF